jgi:ABC-type transport system involved in multi-copper enzyme maturation permease subunit
MGAIGRIAVNVFKESVRDKVLYNLVFFAILLMAASLLLGQLTAGQEVKIIKDLGLAATSIFGLFIAVFIGIGLVSKEVERRSIYALLVKPISRPQFIVGKYAGLVLTLAVNLSIMAVALYAVLAWTDATATEAVRKAWEAPALDPQLVKAVLLIFAQLAIVTAVALLFSTFSSPLLSAALTFGLFVVGHFNQDLRNFEHVVESSALGYLLRAFYHVLPDLSAFNVTSQVVHGQAVPWSYMGATLAYGSAYIASLLVVAVWIFSRRDFK